TNVAPAWTAARIAYTDTGAADDVDAARYRTGAPARVGRIERRAGLGADGLPKRATAAILVTWRASRASANRGTGRRRTSGSCGGSPAGAWPSSGAPWPRAPPADGSTALPGRHARPR